MSDPAARVARTLALALLCLAVSVALAAAVSFAGAAFSPWTALAMGTRDAARFMGQSDEWGRVAPGLRADLLITDGDPLQITTSVQDVIIGGRSVGTDSKHTRLYERYRARLRDPGRAHLR